MFVSIGTVDQHEKVERAEISHTKQNPGDSGIHVVGNDIPQHQESLDIE